jgi:hypothetical protein
MLGKYWRKGRMQMEGDFSDNYLCRLVGREHMHQGKWIKESDLMGIILEGHCFGHRHHGS